MNNKSERLKFKVIEKIGTPIISPSFTNGIDINR